MKTKTNLDTIVVMFLPQDTAAAINLAVVADDCRPASIACQLLLLMTAVNVAQVHVTMHTVLLGGRSAAMSAAGGVVEVVVLTAAAAPPAPQLIPRIRTGGGSSSSCCFFVVDGLGQDGREVGRGRREDVS